jgi:hypothetical protein
VLLHCHCERPTGAWQSHSINRRLLRRFTPRNDTLLSAFVLIRLQVRMHIPKNLPFPLFAKEGYIASLWQREVRRDFLNNVVIFMASLVAMNILWLARGMIGFISYPDGQPSNRRDISSNSSADSPR